MSAPDVNENLKAPIGVVTEQGDLGLGFNQLNESDQTAYENAPSNKKEDEKK